MKRVLALWVLTLLFLNPVPGSAEGDAAAKAGIPKLERPNIVLLTVDNLRRDAVSGAGIWGEIPAFKRLLAAGVAFSNSYHPSPDALTNVTSLLTGLCPPRHGVRDNRHFRLGETVRTLAEVFKEEGYGTFALLGSKQYSVRFGLARKFDLYDDSMLPKNGTAKYPPPVTLAFKDLNDKWFDIYEHKIAPAKAPFFLWIHAADIRPSYEKYSDRSDGGASYGDKVRQFAGELDRLMVFLKDKGLLENTLFVLVSSKPQNLGEHEGSVHALGLYDTDLEAVMVISNPRLFPRPLEIGALASPMDLFPTLVDLALPGKAARASEGGLCDGMSLVPRIKDPAGTDTGERQLYLESFLPLCYYGLKPVYGLRTQGHKLIVDGKDRLMIDLAADPFEIQDPAPSNPALADDLLGRLAGIQKSISPEITERSCLLYEIRDPETRDLFKKLTGLDLDPVFLDPLTKDVEGNLKAERGFLNYFSSAKPISYNDAVKKVRGRLQKNPGDLIARIMLASVYQPNPAYEVEAVSEAYLALKQDPFYLPVYEWIARDYARTKTSEKIKTLLEFAVRVNPEEFYLADQLAKLYDASQDAGALKKFIDDAARKSLVSASNLWVGIGGQKFASGNMSETLAIADSALQLYPKNLSALVLRTVAKIRLGRIREAEPDLKLLEKDDPASYAEIASSEVLYWILVAKNIDKARELNQIYLRMSPDLFEAHMAEIIVLESSGKAQDALRKAKHLLGSQKDERKRAMVLEKIGNLYLGLNDRGQAKKYFEQALKIEPYLPQSANNYAWIVGVEERRMSKGFVWIEKALSRAPNQAAVLDTLAELYYLSGKPTYALEVETRALKLEPKNEEYQKRLEKYQKEGKVI